MEAAYRPPNILRLSGISVKDYVSTDDLLERQLLEDASDAHASEQDDTAWDKIPMTFTSLDEWPLSTNLRCWDMDCTFDGRPAFIATYVVENGEGELEIGVKGNFATFNNAARYIISHYSDREERLKALDLLCLVYRLFTGRKVARIEPAPPKERKLQYGGTWDDDTYWRRLRELDPINGLRDHTLGSIKSEQERILAIAPRAVEEPVIPFTTVWSLCDGVRNDASEPPIEYGAVYGESARAGDSPTEDIAKMIEKIENGPART